MESFETKRLDNLSMFILFCSCYVQKGAVFNMYRTQHYWSVILNVRSVKYEFCLFLGPVYMEWGTPV